MHQLQALELIATDLKKDASTTIRANIDTQYEQIKSRLDSIEQRVRRIVDSCEATPPRTNIVLVSTSEYASPIPEREESNISLMTSTETVTESAAYATAKENMSESPTSQLTEPMWDARAPITTDEGTPPPPDTTTPRINVSTTAGYGLDDRYGTAESALSLSPKGADVVESAMTDVADNVVQLAVMEVSSTTASADSSTTLTQSTVERASMTTAPQQQKPDEAPVAKTSTEAAEMAAKAVAEQVAVTAVEQAVEAQKQDDLLHSSPARVLSSPTTAATMAEIDAQMAMSRNLLDRIETDLDSMQSPTDSRELYSLAKRLKQVRTLFICYIITHSQHRNDLDSHHGHFDCLQAGVTALASCDADTRLQVCSLRYYG